MNLKIVFTKPKNKKFPIFSWLIRFILKTEYSHCAFILQNKTLGEQIICESVGIIGVRIISPLIWAKNNEVVYCCNIELSKRQYLQAFRFFIRNSGKSYGYLQNLFIMLKIPYSKNYRDNNYNCSEFVATLLTKFGVNFNKNLNEITPRDLYEVLNGR